VQLYNHKYFSFSKSTNFCARTEYLMEGNGM